MNRMLIIVKAEETVSMIKNVVVSFIEVEDCRDGNIHAFEIMSVEWLPKDTMLRRLKISKVIRMVVNCFKKHRISFQFDPDTEMLEWVNLMKLKCADQRFGLGYKPKKDDYKRAIKIKRKARMTKVE